MCAPKYIKEKFSKAKRTTKNSVKLMLRAQKAHKPHPVPNSDTSYSCIHLWSLFSAKAHLRPGLASSIERKTYSDKNYVKLNSSSFFCSFLMICSFLQTGQMEKQKELWRGFKQWKNNPQKGKEKSQFSLNLHLISTKNMIHKTCKQARSQMTCKKNP